MQKQYFENKNFIEFLKTEFKTRRKSDGVFGTILSFFQLPVFGIVNYPIKKKWIETYKSIENYVSYFYSDLNCNFNGERPSFIKKLKNYGEKRIEFKFDKAHLAVTRDSLYFFPFDSAGLKSKAINYDMLEEPFRIIYNSEEKRDKYSIIKTIPELVSLKTENGNTTIEFKISESDTRTKLIFDREITVANKTET